MGKWFDKIKKILNHIRGIPKEESELPQEEWINPYISGTRSVIEQILSQKGLDYRRFCPLILDTDCPGQVFGEEDDVDQVLEQLAEGLNFLEISTDRPEHFTDWTDRMQQEYGLLVRILPRSGDDRTYGNMVLDLERHQPMRADRFGKDVLYLPFYKRRWIPAESGGEASHTTGEQKESDVFPDEENLDIKVPIGYNMLIVKVDKNILRQDM